MKTKLNTALKKYGFYNFIFDIIDTASSQNELDKKEIYYIDSFNTIEHGYNLTSGGNGHICSEETRIKMSVSKKEYLKTHKHHRIGSKNTVEHNNAVRQYMTNRVVCEETKLKMSIYTKSNPIKNSNTTRFKKNHVTWNKNITPSDDVKQKIKLSLLLKNKEKYGFIGIVPYKITKWLAKVYVKSHEKCCKVFLDKVEAAKWFDIKQIEYNGKTAPTNMSLGFYK